MRLTVLPLLLIEIGTVATLQLERCWDVLDEAILSPGSIQNWGDLAAKYRCTVCKCEWGATNEQFYRKGFESVMMGEQDVASFLKTIENAHSLATDEPKYQRICNFLEAFASGSDCDGESAHLQRRRTQDDSCPLDLLQWVQDDTDGRLTLDEYYSFFTSRYYSRCDFKRVDLDDTTRISSAQSEAFVSLSCLICLRNLGTVTMIPDCCRPDMASIPLDDPDSFSFARICTTARSAAIEDCSYLALLTTAQPQQPILPNPEAPAVSPTIFAIPAPRPVAAPVLSPVFRPISRPIVIPSLPQAAPVLSPTWQISAQPLSECSKQLVVSDNNPSDGVLTSSEFSSFLLNRFGRTCILRQPENSIQGLFQQLACSSCLSGTATTLDCCLPQVARISIKDAYNGVESNWINRICFNADTQIQVFCNAAPPQPLPVAPPVMVPVRTPVTVPVTLPVAFPPPAPVLIPRPPPAPPQMPPIVRFPTTITQPSTAPATSLPSFSIQGPISSAPTTKPFTSNPFSDPTNEPEEMVRHDSPPPTLTPVTTPVTAPVPAPVTTSTRSPVTPFFLTPVPSMANADPITFFPTTASSTSNPTVTIATSAFTLPPISSPLPESIAKRTKCGLLVLVCFAMPFLA